MRVEQVRYRRFRAWSLARALLLFAAGAAVAAFSVFWLIIGVVAFFVSDPYPILNGLLFTVLGGVIPGIGAVLLVWRGALWIRRRSRMTRLVGLVAGRADVRFEQVVAAMRIGPAAVEDSIIDGVRQGIFPRTELASLTGLQRDDGSIVARSTAVLTPTQVSPPRPLPIGSASTIASVPPPASSAPHRPAPVPMTSWVASLVGRLILGTYRIEAHLGTGGMGAVFRAQHVRTGRRYAFKVLLSDGSISPDAIRRFEREATAASALGHPGLVAVHDFNRTEDGVPFLVMDLLDGETLLQRLDRYGSLPWPAAQRIALETGDALACAHEHGLLHRDIKPANIFLARASNGMERAVLLDFGLVKPMQVSTRSRVTASGVAVGTPLYMSPEQARGEAIDVRSDLYSLAAVTYEMVTGTPVFFDSTLPAVYARLLNEPAPLASQVVSGACPSGLDQLLARALAKRPEDRPATVRVFLAELARIKAPVAKATVVL